MPIIVGDSCFADREASYCSDRAYEAPGRGAFSIFPEVDFVREELVRVPSQVYYEPGDLDAVGDLVDHWLAKFREDPELRASS